MRRIFISHAGADKELVDLFVDLLISGIGISHTEIFYTSQRDQGIPSGKDFKSHIKGQLQNTELTFSLVSENYYTSAFCMCELGAVWIDSKDHIPVLIPPVDFKQLRAVLEGLQARKIFDPDDLDIIRDETIKRLDIKEPRGVGFWAKKRDEFIARGKEVAAKLPKSDQVARSALEKSEKEKQGLQKEIDSLVDEKERLEKINRDLFAVKDQKAVAQIKKKHIPDADRFKELVRAAKEALSELPLIVRRALYFQFANEPFVVDDRQDWPDVDSARRAGYLAEGEGRNTFFTTPGTNKKLKIAEKTVEQLAKFLDEEASSDFHESYEDDHDTPANITLAPFWQEHLGVRV